MRPAAANFDGLLGFVTILGGAFGLCGGRGRSVGVAVSGRLLMGISFGRDGRTDALTGGGGVDLAAVLLGLGTLLPGRSAARPRRRYRRPSIVGPNRGRVGGPAHWVGPCRKCAPVVTIRNAAANERIARASLGGADAARAHCAVEQTDHKVGHSAAGNGPGRDGRSPDAQGGATLADHAGVSPCPGSVGPAGRVVGATGVCAPGAASPWRPRTWRWTTTPVSPRRCLRRCCWIRRGAGRPTPGYVLSAAVLARVAPLAPPMDARHGEGEQQSSHRR